MSSRHVQAIGSNTNMVQCTYSVHNIIFLVDEFERSIGCPALSEPEEITIVQHGKDHAGDCTVNVSSRNISM